MRRLIVVQPLPIAAVAASRGAGALNLRTDDPKEVWADSASGSATLTVDLGAAVAVDTILLGYLSGALAAATWSITGGVADPAEAVLQAQTVLRVPDVSGDTPARSHALFTGATRTVRYLAITVTQPIGGPALSAGVLVVGRAFVAALGHEWGAGRRPVDTGTATALPSGGFSVVEGAHKRAYSWTFGDLSVEEADQLELIGLALGETRPGLVVEDPDRTAGLRARIHYGLFRRWAAYERRNRQQTRWELGIEQWI